MTSTTTKVTADQIIEEVRRLAAEQPDFVYAKPEGSHFCLYKHEDGPGCIFGQALDNLGIGVDEHTQGTIGNVLVEFAIHASNKQRNWMRDVQHYQDTGYDWATSVARADEDDPLV